jgi:RNA polymerase sigma-70 factor (ECF subfamily)
MAERLDAVLTVIYLVFNEGYAATRGNSLLRGDLCNEAIRLARLVVSLMAPYPPREVLALLAMMLLHDARREARTDGAGEIVVLEEQDRRLWKKEQIAEAMPLVHEAMEVAPGPLTLQAAIAAEHCRAARPEETDWREIVRLYGELERVQPSPVVALNRAVAVAMAEGPERGLALMEELAASSDLEKYHLLHAARADMHRRLGRFAEAAREYERALGLATNESEKRYLEKRLREVRKQGSKERNG